MTAIHELNGRTELQINKFEYKLVNQRYKNRKQSKVPIGQTGSCHELGPCNQVGSSHAFSQQCESILLDVCASVRYRAWIYNARHSQKID